MKRLIGICIVGVLMASSMAYSVEYLGESLLNGSGKISYVDWIISDAPLTSGITSGFNFAYHLGTNEFYEQADYDDSQWYYYFQVENISGAICISFKINIDPEAIQSAGYILDVDLDTDLDVDHVVSGEYEPATSSSPVNFTNATLDPYGDGFTVEPNVTISFQTQFFTGKETTVFFITAGRNTIPAIFLSEITLIGIHSPILRGELPGPIAIPEPATIILLGGTSLIALRLRKNRK
ncbi:MAG: PEP-CTERM sorting domain-containing protein [Candidatus Auribacterota bacterium]|jgi:hypothetical protein|nr:PEP-CTERM sorting domain-containing protein [Candidatus Auribacterota bacterium]